MDVPAVELASVAERPSTGRVPEALQGGRSEAGALRAPSGPSVLEICAMQSRVIPRASKRSRVRIIRFGQGEGRSTPRGCDAGQSSIRRARGSSPVMRCTAPSGDKCCTVIHAQRSCEFALPRSSHRARCSCRGRASALRHGQAQRSTPWVAQRSTPRAAAGLVASCPAQRRDCASVGRSHAWVSAGQEARAAARRSAITANVSEA
jgi:hypothetical protein